MEASMNELPWQKELDTVVISTLRMRRQRREAMWPRSQDQWVAQLRLNRGLLSSRIYVLLFFPHSVHIFMALFTFVMMDIILQQFQQLQWAPGGGGESAFSWIFGAEIHEFVPCVPPPVYVYDSCPCQKFYWRCSWVCSRTIVYNSLLFIITCHNRTWLKRDFMTKNLANCLKA